MSVTKAGAEVWTGLRSRRPLKSGVSLELNWRGDMTTAKKVRSATVLCLFILIWKNFR